MRDFAIRLVLFVVFVGLMILAPLGELFPEDD